MPSKHRHPAAMYRPDPELYERAKVAAGEVGGTMNGHILGFLAWLVGDTDELPPRPAGTTAASQDAEETSNRN